MSTPDKPQSPFYPEHPVPPDLFTGRERQVNHLVSRGFSALPNRPHNAFIEAEYGMGKTSLATYLFTKAPDDFFCLRVPLGGCISKAEFAEYFVRALDREAFVNKRGMANALRAFFERYGVSAQVNLGLVGIGIDPRAARENADQFASPHGMLEVLEAIIHQPSSTGKYKAAVVALDEINGLASQPWFSQFLKSFIDMTANGGSPVMLLLNGTAQRRREMIAAHQSIAQVFDVQPLAPMSYVECQRFYQKALDSAGIAYEADAISMMAFWSAGHPRIVQIIGNQAFWMDDDNVIDQADAMKGLHHAAVEIGTKFFKSQIYDALRSVSYRKILQTMAEISREREEFGRDFTRGELLSKLGENEKARLDNFLTRMRQLGALVAGEERGTYRFAIPMIEPYIAMQFASEDKTVPARD